MSVMDKLKKNSKIKTTDILSDSIFFGQKTMVKTEVPMINVALSGDPDGGLTSGLTVLAGPSKHFKTSFALLMASAYLKEHKDAVMLFYDSEFGSPQSYFEAFGIDTTRVLHTPITDVEQLKFDLVGQLDNIERKDKVIIVIDSIGNLASKKELEDALNEKSVNIEKSRMVKEKSKIPVSVSWDGGVERNSGLLDIALAGGFVVKPNNGWYCMVDQETGEMVEPKVREKQTRTDEFWAPILGTKKFKEFLIKQYQIGHKSLIDFDPENPVQGE